MSENEPDVVLALKKTEDRQLKKDIAVYWWWNRLSRYLPEGGGKG